MSPNTPAEDLRDDFTSTTLDTDKWTAGGATGGVALVSDQLALTPAVSGGDAALINSAEQYDLTGSSVMIQIIGLSDIEQQAWVSVTAAGPSAGFQVTNGGTQARTFTNIPGTGQVFGADASTGGTVGWVRIRESEGLLYWDWSADGLSWANVYSIAAPFDLTAIEFQVMALPDTGVTWTATFDNCNVGPG